VLTTAMLLNTLTFCLAEPTCTSSSSSGKIEKEMGAELNYDWMKIQIGLTSLLARTRPFHKDSIWLVMFQYSDEFHGSQDDTTVVDDGEEEEEGLSKRLGEFCFGNWRDGGEEEDGDGDEERETSIYKDFFEKLAPLLDLPPAPEHLLWYVRPVGAISYDFLARLEARDTKAVLLFAYWLALMCGVEMWWCVGRVTRECRLCCRVLDRVLVGRDRWLLEWPAERCGYKMI
jgi:hypothetical protein